MFKREDLTHLFNVTINIDPRAICWNGFSVGSACYDFRSSGRIYEHILLSVIKETLSRCTKLAEKKCSALLYEQEMNLYLLDKEFMAGRSRLQLTRISN